MNEFVSKSMKLVITSLENKILTQSHILEKTKLSPRTLRYAISRLKQLGLVEEINGIKDTRTKKYFLKNYDLAKAIKKRGDKK